MTRGVWDGQAAAATEEEGTGGPGAGLYEREAELAALSAALAEARAGTGGLVVVEGPAGIGKSRLLAEARAAAAARGMTVLTARGTDLEREAPFGVVAELFATARTAVQGAAIQAGTSAAGSGRLGPGQASLATPLFDPAVPPGGFLPANRVKTYGSGTFPARAEAEHSDAGRVGRTGRGGNRRGRNRRALGGPVRTRG